MKAEWTNKDSLTSGETTKAVLVVDLPKNCAECKLMYLQGIGEGICNAVDWEERPSWCPLRPMPKKDDGKLTEYCGDWGCGYADGWNTCLDKIMGETE